MPKPYDDIRKLSPAYEWVRIVHGLDKETIPPEKVRAARRCYLAMCTWLDDRIGFLLSELERLGTAQGAMVVFTSDHSDMVDEKGQWFNRINLERSARVPLIIRWPGGVPRGERVNSPVSLVGLFPTITEKAGIECEPKSMAAASSRSLAGANLGGIVRWSESAAAGPPSSLSAWCVAAIKSTSQ